MLPSELVAKKKELKEKLGAHNINIFVQDTNVCIYINVTVYHTYQVNSTKTADNWEDLFTEAEEQWPIEWSKAFPDYINKLALKIIELSSTEGGCTKAKLRLAFFQDRHVDLYGFQAIIRAGEMSSKAPFSIIPDETKSNGSPSIETPEDLESPVKPPSPPSRAPLTQEELDDEIPF